MTKINLLPPEIHAKQKTRRTTTLIAAAGLAVIVLLAVFWFMQTLTEKSVARDLAAQKSTNAGLQQQVNELSQFDQIQADIQKKEDLLGTLMENEVHWSGVLRDLSLVIPSTAWLTNMSASVHDSLTGSTATSLTATSSDIIGSITFDGNADRHPTVAEWLTSLEKIRGFLNPWISQSGVVGIGGFPVAHFTSSVDLSKDVTVEGRAAR